MSLSGPCFGMTTPYFVHRSSMATYIGMISSEHSSGERQRLGAMSKQRNTLLHYLWWEAAMHAAERDPSWLLKGNDGINRKWHVFMETISSRHHVSGACYLARVPICETGMKIARRVFDRILSPSLSYRGVG